jgi:hypothetical protein
MSQRVSGYARKERDCYETPAWVTACLMPHIGKNLRLWEPAAGNGNIVEALRGFGHEVVATDIAKGGDFLMSIIPGAAFNGIVTNPPYELAERFIMHALDLTKPHGFVAMLLRTDFDHAKSRKTLFTEGPFWRKVVLTKRIRWFPDSTGSPSFNHAWFIWDWNEDGRMPTIAYEP